MKVSVIVPAYNSEMYLQRCIDSIIVARKNHDVEIIIINDGSTDRTLDIAQSIARSNDKIVVVSQNNKGLSGARNSGLAKATGKYIAFVDSDDTITSNYFDILFPLMDGENEIIDFGYYKVSEDNITPHSSKKNILKDDVINNMVTTSSKSKSLWYVWRRVFLKSLLNDNFIIFEEKIKYGEDSIFMLKVLRKLTYGITIDECLYNYYDTPDSLTNVAYKEELLEKFELQYLERKNIEFTNIDHKLIERDVAKNYIEHTLFAMLHNLKNSSEDKINEVKKIRNSIIYNETFKNYRYSSSTGFKRFLLIKLFQYKLYTPLFKLLKINA